MSKMQNEIAWEDDFEIISKDTEKWWRKIKHWFAVAKKKRGQNKENAMDELEEAFKQVVTTVKKKAAREVNDARSDIIKQDHQHPLFHKVERQENMLVQTKQFLRRYKTELKKYMEEKEFSKLRDEIEGDFDLLHEIQRLRDDMRYKIREISKKTNAEAYSGTTEDEKNPENAD
jgi:hypothetical protein